MIDCITEEKVATALGDVVIYAKSEKQHRTVTLGDIIGDWLMEFTGSDDPGKDGLEIQKIIARAVIEVMR